MKRAALLKSVGGGQEGRGEESVAQEETRWWCGNLEQKNTKSSKTRAQLAFFFGGGTGVYLLEDLTGEPHGQIEGKGPGRRS